MFDPVEYFEGKSVLLVGNGELMHETNYSDYDCIVRMNLGGIEKPCDVWIDNLVFKGHNLLPQIPYVKNMMRLNCEKDGRRLKRLPEVLKKRDDIFYWNVADFQTMCDRFNYQRPTSGFISIYFLLYCCDCDLSITGFDFFATRNRYTMEVHPNSNEPAYPCHNMGLEKQIINDWVSEGKLTIK